MPNPLDFARALLPFALCTSVATMPVPGSSEPAKPGEGLFAGSAACGACHRNEMAAWRGSHHDLAMQEATDKTVLGDFDGATFTYGDVTSRFFRRDGKFFVNTDGPDGKLADFEIRFTFGVIPLQQYKRPAELYRQVQAPVTAGAQAKAASIQIGGQRRLAIQAGARPVAQLAEPQKPLKIVRRPAQLPPQQAAAPPPPQQQAAATPPGWLVIVRPSHQQQPPPQAAAPKLTWPIFLKDLENGTRDIRYSLHHLETFA